MIGRDVSRRRVLLAAASGSVLSVSVLAGCLGEDDEGDETGNGGDDATDDEDSDADTNDGRNDVDGIDEEFVDATGEDVVTVETREGEGDEPDFVFDPAFVTVDAGTTIEWENTDGVFHTVTSTDDIDERSGGGEVFDETLSTEGDTFEWEANEGGIQPYYCSPHAGFMYGAIEVE